MVCNSNVKYIKEFSTNICSCPELTWKKRRRKKIVPTYQPSFQMRLKSEKMLIFWGLIVVLVQFMVISCDRIVMAHSVLGFSLAHSGFFHNIRPQKACSPWTLSFMLFEHRQSVVKEKQKAFLPCYVPGITRKELGNQILVFEKSAKSTFKI